MEKKQVTKNGVSVYSYPNQNLHSFYIALYVKAGLLYESPDKAGITHALEHLVFRNVKRLTDGKLYYLLDKHGLTMNAATCKEFVQFTISGAYQSFKQAADIISLVLEPPEICMQDFKTELARIRCEIREEGEKTSVAGISNKNVWSGTTLENSISGNGKNLCRFSRKNIKEWHNDIFNCHNMFWYVTGNVKQDDLDYLAMLTQKHSVSSLPLPKDNIAPVPCNFFNRHNTVIFKNSDFCKVMLSFDLDCQKISFAVRHILYSILFDGESSLVFGGLSEDSGLVYSYDCCIEEYQNIGCFKLSYEVKQANLIRSLEILTSILNRLKTQPSGILELSKVPYVKNSELALDNPFDLNWDMAFENHILQTGCKSRKDRSDAFTAVSDKEITQAAGELFTTSNSVTVIKADLKQLDTKRVEEVLYGLDK